MYTSMGRGRKGLIDQSEKKPKNPQMKPEVNLGMYCIGNPVKINTDFLSKDFLEALKRMELKEVADILFK